MAMAIPVFSQGETMRRVPSRRRSDEAPAPLSTGLPIGALKRGRVFVSQVRVSLHVEREKRLVLQMEAWLCQ
jgi:hypothetical protein